MSARMTCGLIVNPETLRHVIDRQLVYGTSRTLFEEVRFDENMVTSVDWATYPVLYINSVPQSIEIELIEPARGGAVGRRRDGARPRPRRDRQRRLRCHGRALAARALHLRARQGGARPVLAPSAIPRGQLRSEDANVTSDHR